MRVFLAGASGVIGRRLIPLLRERGHVVTGLSRSQEGARRVETLGAEAVACDVYDADALCRAVVAAAPDIVLHELTDLPDDTGSIPAFRQRHARIRVEGTRNLLTAARAAGVTHVLAQSVAWPMGDAAGADAVASLETQVLAANGVVMRYGQFYGADTFHPEHPPRPPRVHIDRAATATVDALGEAGGILVITDDGTTRAA